MSPALSVLLDSYGADARQAFSRARRDGFAQIEAGTLTGDLRPSELSTSGRRHLLRVLRDQGLSLAGLAVEHAGAGLADLQFADRRLAEARAALELAADLGVPRATVRVAGWDNAETGAAASQILQSLANDADRFGVRIAIGASDPEIAKLSDAVEKLRAPGLGILLSSTAAVRPDADVQRAARLAAAVRLRDGFVRGESWEETPLGSGQVDFHALLAELATAEFSQDLTLQRAAAARDVDALRRDRDTISALLGGGPR
ncbi:MAG: TIM barrel protein [Phycisphaerae bacterium]|nr:TIM barrel protein [Phycisphaerae bacterium]